MNSFRLALFAVAALALAGCRTRPEQRAVMDAYQEELRRYEGIIYDLEYENEVLCTENERLKERLGRLAQERPSRVDSGPGLFSPRRPPPPARSDPNATDDMELTPPVIERNDIPDAPPRSETRSGAIHKAVAPDVEQAVADPDDDPAGDDDPPAASVPAAPAKAPPPSMDDAADDPPSPPSVLVPNNPLNRSDESLPAPKPGGAKPPELLPPPTPRKVSQLYIDPRLTRGFDRDQQGGDDGLRVVLEPRSDAGELVPVAGPVSVVLIDPARQGDAARVGRWEFDEDLVRYQLALTGKRNIALEAPWIGRPPQNSRLMLFVRFQTEEGEQIEASREVTILLPGQVSNRWTPRPQQRRGPLVRQNEVASDEPRAAEAPITPAAHAEPEPSEPPVTAVRVPQWKPYR